MKAIRTAMTLVVAITVGACDLISGSEDGARIRPELVRLPGAAAGNPLAQRVAAMDPGDGHATSNLEIESLRVPIHRIALANSSDDDVYAKVYECNGGCLVDLASPTFETNLLSSSTVTVDVGTYDQIDFGFCEGATTYTVYLTARATLNDTVYYTKANGSLSTEAPAEAAEIEQSGCGNSSSMPYAITVVDNGTIAQDVPDGEDAPQLVGDADLRLYFTTEDIAWAAKGTTYAIWFPGSCALPIEQAEAGEPYVCVGYPDVGAFIGTDVPAIERYATNITTSITLFVRDDLVMGGYLRRYLEAAIDPNLPFMGATGSFYEIGQNANGSISILGIQVDGGPDREYAFPQFFRSSHTGSFADHYGTVESYTATRLQ